MAIYDAGFGPKYNILFSWIGREKRILDVGCGAGVFSARLAADNEVAGVEMSAENYVLAKQRIPVYFGDFVQLDIGGRYDIVLFADVLEHMYEPRQAIQKARNLANEIIISVPNIQCFIVTILQLLGIRKTKTGILDETHVFFFTKATIEDMIHESGLAILDYACPRPRRAPGPYQYLINLWPERFGIVFMYRCRVL